MTLLIIAASIIVYACVGSVICGVHDAFFEIDKYLIFWPVIVIVKNVKRLFGGDSD